MLYYKPRGSDYFAAFIISIIYVLDLLYLLFTRHAHSRHHAWGFPDGLTIV